MGGGTLNTKTGETLQFEGRNREKMCEGNYLCFLCEIIITISSLPLLRSPTVKTDIIGRKLS